MMVRLKHLRGSLLGTSQVMPENRQLYTATNLLYEFALLIQVMLATILALLGQREIALYTAPGLLLFMVTLVLNRRGLHHAALVLAVAALLAQAVLAVISLGWAAGFQNLILLGAFVVFLPNRWAGPIKLAFAVAACVLYISLQFYAQGHVPLSFLDAGVLSLLNMLNTVILFAGLAMLARYYSSIARVSEARLKVAYRELERSARTDPLTLLLNRRGITERIEAEIVRTRRSEEPFTLVLSDIDDFRVINVRHGHDRGDMVLMTVANLMDEVLREQDQVARWGGGQFMFLLPETNLAGGGIAAERVRQRIAEHQMTLDGEPYRPTLTFGVSTVTKDKSIKDAIREAEHALELGKQQGKDRVVLAE